MYRFFLLPNELGNEFNFLSKTAKHTKSGFLIYIFLKRSKKIFFW